MKASPEKGAAAVKEGEAKRQPPQERQETLVDFILRAAQAPSQVPPVSLIDYLDVLHDVVAVTASLNEAEGILTSIYYDMLSNEGKLFGGTDAVCRAIARVHEARVRFIGVSEYHTQGRSTT